MNFEQDKNPKLRGVFHICGTVVSFTLFTIVCFASYYNKFNPFVFVFLLIQTVQFGISSIYHIASWSGYKRTIMRKIDHAAIIVLIYTIGEILLHLHHPSLSEFIFLGIPTGFSEIQVVSMIEKFMIFLSSVAILKVSIIGLYDSAVDQILYLSLGVLFVPVLFSLKMTTYTSIILILAAGFLDIIGAIIFVTEKPNPIPEYIGFHEVFHLLTLFAFFLWAYVISKQYIAELNDLDPVLKALC